MFDFSVDDFGEVGGKRFFEFRQQAWRHAQQWRPKALGQRPHDWMNRDLLLGGMQSDPRNWAYRTLLQHEHPRVCTDGFTARDAYILRRAKAFLFLHYVAASRLAGQNGMKRYETRLRSCPPNLYLVHSPEGADMRVCGLAHVCPFCLARRAQSVYTRVRGLVCRPQHDQMPQSIYVLLSVQSSTHREEAIGDWVNARKADISRRLRKRAVELGGVGGVSAFQLMPHPNQRVRFRDGNFGVSTDQGYGLRCSDLFEVPIGRACDWGLGDRAPEQVLGLDSLLGADADAHGIIEVETDRDALRSLIFGEAPGNPNSLWLPGQPGLLVYPQLHLAMPNQIAEILRATKNKRLFSFWGSWKGRGTAFQSAQIDGTSNSIVALSSANANRAAQADTEAARKLQQMEPWISEYHDAHGRPPGRTTLQQIARDNDINLTDRLARRITKQLNNNN